MLEKLLQFGSDRAHLTRSSPALWFFLLIKQSGFVWEQIAPGAASERQVN
jgi:hypothetical protein